MLRRVCAIALLMSRVAHLDYYREGFRAPRTLFSCLTTSLHVSATHCPRVCTLQHTVQKVTSLRCSLYCRSEERCGPHRLLA